MKLALALPACVAMLLAVFPHTPRAAEAAAPPPALEIRVQGALASGVVQQVSDLTGQDLVMYGLPDGARMDLSGEFAGADDFFQQAAARLGLKVQKLEGLNMLSRVCAETPPQGYPFLAKGKLSLNFQRIELKGLLEIFNDFYNLKADTAALSRPPLGIITLRMKELQGERALSAALTAAGLRLVAGDGRAFRFEKLPQRDGCDPSAGGMAGGLAGFEPSPKPPARPAAAKGGDTPRLRLPLENYDLEKIALRGHLRVAGKAFGLAETPDGIAWALRVGDYLGKNYGQVVEVRADRIRLREIRMNMFGLWQEQTLELGLNRQASHEGASRYEEAVRELHGYARFVQELPRLCAAHVPDGGAGHAAALKRWLAANAQELAELDAHVRAYAGREAAQQAQVDPPHPPAPTDALVAYSEAGFQEMSRQIIEGKAAGRGGERERFCMGQAASTAQESSRLKERYADELGALATCEAQGHCPNLAGLRRR